MVVTTQRVMFTASSGQRPGQTHSPAALVLGLRTQSPCVHQSHQLFENNCPLPSVSSSVRNGSQLGLVTVDRVLLLPSSSTFLNVRELTGRPWRRRLALMRQGLVLA